MISAVLHPDAPLSRKLDVAGAALSTPVISSDVSVFKGELVACVAVRLVDLWIRAVLDLIKSVFARSAVFEVSESIVRRVTVQMASLQTLGARFHESVHDEGVDEACGDSTLKRETHPTVSVLGDPTLEIFPAKNALTGLTRKASHLALVGNFVQAFVPDYRQPVLGGAI